MEFMKITPEQKAMLDLPLPDEAITRHPTKTFLSSIKSVYVTERLNDVFGVGQWRIKSEVTERSDKGMVVVKVFFSVPEYNIEYECYGGNNNGGEASKNFDLGDAYKGAVTDAISKIGSWMGIGADVFKGKHKPGASTPPVPPKKKKQFNREDDSQINCLCDLITGQNLCGKNTNLEKWTLEQFKNALEGFTDPDYDWLLWRSQIK